MFFAQTSFMYLSMFFPRGGGGGGGRAAITTGSDIFEKCQNSVEMPALPHYGKNIDRCISTLPHTSMISGIEDGRSPQAV